MHRSIFGGLRCLAVAGLCLACDMDRGRFAEYTPAAQEFVVAASHGDFETVRTMSADTVPLNWMRLSYEDEPELLRAAGEGLQPLGGTVRNDTTFVRFGFEYRGRTEVLSFRFVSRGEQRLVTNVSLPERI